MASFVSPQDLEIHYDREHLNGNGNFNHLKDEVQELVTTLKEEQFHSAELKKEVEKLSTAVQKSTENTDNAEADMFQSQVNALSEAKDLRKNSYSVSEFSKSFLYETFTQSVSLISLVLHI